MTGTERKRRWREKQANREAEAKRDATRASRRGAERSTTEGRLAEAIRDTIRRIDNQEQA